jgi:pimeloyl-ACP methyl ester carboxylesterase
VHAVVSCGGRPDLAGETLEHVEAPALLIVGSGDDPVAAMNRDALKRLRAHAELAIVPGASHAEDRGTLDEVARLVSAWCQRYLWSMA